MRGHIIIKIERNMSLVGFWEDLGQKRVKEILKVGIVSFLYFFPFYILFFEFWGFIMT